MWNHSIAVHFVIFVEISIQIFSQFLVVPRRVIISVEFLPIFIFGPSLIVWNMYYSNDDDAVELSPLHVANETND